MGTGNSVRAGLSCLGYLRGCSAVGVEFDGEGGSAAHRHSLILYVDPVR
jgi:hypothetical protein